MNKNFNSIYSEIDSVNYSVLKRETLQVMYDKISKDQINQLQNSYELCGGQLTLNEDTIPCEDGCVGG